MIWRICKGANGRKKNTGHGHKWKHSETLHMLPEIHDIYDETAQKYSSTNSICAAICFACVGSIATAPILRAKSDVSEVWANLGLRKSLHVFLFHFFPRELHDEDPTNLGILMHFIQVVFTPATSLTAPVAAYCSPKCLEFGVMCHQVLRLSRVKTHSAACTFGRQIVDSK